MSEDSSSASAEAEAQAQNRSVFGPLGKNALVAFFRQHDILSAMLVALGILLPGMWAYTLIDPWETHYAEVARRILENNDWIHIKAEDISFRSKPILTFWLMAGSMQTLGIATDGAFSGELVNSAWVIFALRLPFVLFAVMGATTVYWALSRLVHKRVAWISLLVLCTTPFFFLVARQSITDMPMVACLMAALSCFLMASHAEDEEVKPFFKGISSGHVLMFAAAVLVIGQLLYLIFYFRAPGHPVARGVGVSPGVFIFPLITAVFLWSASFADFKRLPAPIRRQLQRIPTFPLTTKRQVYMLWFFMLCGVSALAKGPPGIALTGLVCLLYTLVTGHWKKLLRLELLRGVILAAFVAVPWHAAMFLRDGQPWVQEYFMHHMFKRFGKGVHGDTGTFEYFASQIGIGMWPWVALLPAALALFLWSARRDTQEGRVRLLVGLWAIAGVATFCISETKFHHYILPAIPALSLIVAFFLSDLLESKKLGSKLLLLAALPITLLIARDFAGEEKQLIELFIYRYDRAWPSAEPWSVDIGFSFVVFGALFASLMSLLLWRGGRRYVVPTLLGAALAWAIWVMNSYMPTAAPHWGQRALHQTYYAQRQIHGLDIQYYSLGDLAKDWRRSDDLLVESVIPETLADGQPMLVRIYVPGAGIPGDLVSLRGKVSRIGDERFWINIPREERDKLSELRSRGEKQKLGKRPWRQVNADRLVAWQLNWHGEDFWSGGEMYGDRKDAKTIFKKTDNKDFLAWLKEDERAGRRYFVITEASRAKGLKGVLPTPRAKDTLEVLDTSCNKFTLLRFDL